MQCCGFLGPGWEDCSYQPQQHGSHATECGRRASTTLIPESVSHPIAGSLICLTPALYQERSVLMIKTVLRHSDLEHMQKKKTISAQSRSSTHTKSRYSPPPPACSSARPIMPACEAHSCSGPISTSTLLALGIAPSRQMELSWAQLKEFVFLFFFFFFLFHHVSCLRNSPSVVRKRNKEGQHLELARALHVLWSIHPRHSLGCGSVEEEGRGKRGETDSVIWDCRRWRINGTGGSLWSPSVGGTPALPPVFLVPFSC